MIAEFIAFDMPLELRLDYNPSDITSEYLNNLAQKQAKLAGKIRGLSKEFAVEPIYNLNNYNPTTGEVNVGITTGTAAKALQQGAKIEGQNPIVVNAVVMSADNKLIMGVRNKPEFRKHEPDEPYDYKLHFPTAGYANGKFQSLTDCLYSELKEELNLNPEDISETEFLGSHDDKGYGEGTRFFWSMKSNLTYKQIHEKWQDAEHKWEFSDLADVDADKIPEFLQTTDYSTVHPQATGKIDGITVPVLKYLQYR